MYDSIDTITPDGWRPGVFGSDASGGKFSSIPSLRKCGVGIVQVSQSLELQLAVGLPLPGSVQTIPRAELYAITYVARHVMYGSILVHTDSERSM